MLVVLPAAVGTVIEVLIKLKIVLNNEVRWHNVMSVFHSSSYGKWPKLSVSRLNVQMEWLCLDCVSVLRVATRPRRKSTTRLVWNTSLIYSTRFALPELFTLSFTHPTAGSVPESLFTHSFIQVNNFSLSILVGIRGWYRALSMASMHSVSSLCYRNCLSTTNLNP